MTIIDAARLHPNSDLELYLTSLIHEVEERRHQMREA